MEKRSILVVDDEKNIRLTMFQSLEPLGMPVETAVNGEEALQKLREGQFGLVFLDPKMPGMDGMEVLHRIKEKWPKIQVIIITAHGTVESAVEAMKIGAADFLQSPSARTKFVSLQPRFWSAKLWMKRAPQVTCPWLNSPNVTSATGTSIRRSSSLKEPLLRTRPCPRSTTCTGHSWRSKATGSRLKSFIGPPWTLTPPLNRQKPTWIEPVPGISSVKSNSIPPR